MNHNNQQQQQQQALTDAAEQPRWLGGAAGTWRARASPPPWLGSGAAVFKDAPLSQLPLPTPLGAGRPVTAVHHQHQQQRPLGAVRAVSAHSAARRRARGHNRRTPTPEPPAGQGGYLAPSRGGRVTPQMAVAVSSSASNLGSSLTPLPPVPTQSVQQTPALLPSMEAEAPSPAYHTVVVRGRSGRRGSRTNGGSSSIASAVPAGTDSAETMANSKQNGEHKTLVSVESEASTNGSNIESAPAAHGSDASGSTARAPLKTLQPQPPAQPIPQPTQTVSMAANGSVTSISYMHFLNRQTDQSPSHQQQTLPMTSASPRPKQPPSYAQMEPSTAAVTAPTLTTAAAAASLTTTSTTAATSTPSDSQQPKPLMSVTDGTGCTTEIYPIKSILKKAAAAAAAANGQQLSAAVRPKTAVGFGLKQQQPPPASVAPEAQQLQTPTPSEDQPAPAPAASRRPTVRRAATMQSGKLSLRARSQSAGPRRGVRFDMTSNSVHEYEPAPLVTQPANVPAFTADTEHWYRLMWRRLAEH